MPYATQDDLVPLRLTLRDLVELTDDTESDGEPGAGEVNTAIVDAALADASSRIDSYCRQRYATPLQSSDSIKSICLDLTLYLLYTRRRETRTNETVADRYNAAITFLKDVASGKASLDQPLTASTPQGSSGAPVVTQIPQRFDVDPVTGCDPLGGWA